MTELAEKFGLRSGDGSTGGDGDGGQVRIEGERERERERESESEREIRGKRVLDEVRGERQSLEPIARLSSPYVILNPPNNALRAPGDVHWDRDGLGLPAGQ